MAVFTFKEGEIEEEVERFVSQEHFEDMLDKHKKHETELDHKCDMWMKVAEETHNDLVRQEQETKKYKIFSIVVSVMGLVGMLCVYHL